MAEKKETKPEEKEKTETSSKIKYSGQKNLSTRYGSFKPGESKKVSKEAKKYLLETFPDKFK